MVVVFFWSGDGWTQALRDSWTACDRLLIGSPGNRIVSDPIFVRGQAVPPVAR